MTYFLIQSEDWPVDANEPFGVFSGGHLLCTSEEALCYLWNEDWSPEVVNPLGPLYTLERNGLTLHKCDSISHMYCQSRQVIFANTPHEKRVAAARIWTQHGVSPVWMLDHTPALASTILRSACKHNKLHIIEGTLKWLNSHNVTWPTGWQARTPEQSELFRRLLPLREYRIAIVEGRTPITIMAHDTMAILFPTDTEWWVCVMCRLNVDMDTYKVDYPNWTAVYHMIRGLSHTDGGTLAPREDAIHNIVVFEDTDGYYIVKGIRR